MRIDIYLPRATGFNIEVDEEEIHSKCENFKTTVSLSKGNHTIQAIDQAPTPAFWSKLMSFFDPISQSTGDYSNETSFCLNKDLDVVVSIEHGVYDEVSFEFDDELSEFLE